MRLQTSWGLISQHCFELSLINLDLYVFFCLYQVGQSLPSAFIAGVLNIRSYVKCFGLLILTWSCKYLTHLLHWIHHKIIIFVFSLLISMCYFIPSMENIILNNETWQSNVILFPNAESTILFDSLGIIIFVDTIHVLVMSCWYRQLALSIIRIYDWSVSRIRHSFKFVQNRSNIFW